VKSQRKYVFGLVVAVPVSLVAAGSFYAAAWAGGPTLSAAVADQSSQITTVKETFTNGVTTMISGATPPPTHLAAALRASAEGGVSVGMSATERAGLLSTQHQALGRYFTSDELPNAEGFVKGTLAADGNPDFVDLGNGVSKISFVSVSVDGSSATVQADVTVWAKSQVHTAAEGQARDTAPKGPWLTYNPVNTMRYDAKLTRSAAGAWMINSLVGDFLPGQVP
jgi:hypothetical protein